MALWLMDLIELTMDGSGFTPTVITGLDALSRTGDLEELKALFMDLAMLTQLPEPLLARLKLENVMRAFAAARRVSVDEFFKSEAEVQQEQQNSRQNELEQAAAAGAVDAATKQAVQPQGQSE